MKPSIPLRLFLAWLSLTMNACSILGGKAAEEPAYRVIQEDGAIQVREYRAYAVAETLVRESYTAATNEGFRRLFDYISGANRGSSRIEMTAPVLVSPERIAMTAPVIVTPQTADRTSGTLVGIDDGWMTAFILPEGATARNSPVPQDERVKLRDIPPRRVAAIRFAGLLRNGRAEVRRRELAAWLEARGLAHSGDWRMAGYHPPWTIPPFRRNEVIVTLQGQQ